MSASFYQDFYSPTFSKNYKRFGNIRKRVDKRIDKILSNPYHQRSKQNLQRYREEVHGRLMTTWPIITEATYILKAHVHLQAQLDFLKWIGLGGLEVFELEKEHLPRIIQLQNQYSNLSMDFADATLMVVAETLSISRVFSIDKEFSIYRIPDKKRFENLMK